MELSILIGNLGCSQHIFVKGSAHGCHFPGCDEQGSKFCLHSGDHDEFDGLGDGKDGTIASWDWVIFRVKDIASSPAMGVGLSEETFIGMGSKDHGDDIQWA